MLMVNMGMDISQTLFSHLYNFKLVNLWVAPMLVCIIFVLAK